MKKTLCVLMLAFSASSLAAPVTSSRLAELINQRLGYMQAVAADKARTHKAVEDLAQEQQVLARTAQRAVALGLDGESVKPFIQAQMDAAKAIQYRYRADWLAQPDTALPNLSLAEVREKISSLSDAVLAQTAELLKQKSPPDKAQFLAHLQQTHLSTADKLHIWQALGEVRLAQ
ncbi:chorismate mutase [Pantoea sp. A4]|uniref:chorismate mutase n=1 Tax=Pantoea sp. A4 TaxID=1225184 RepID=UPI00035C2962|nr:chorismate mutase [Pantoea sp. A4]